MPLASFAGDRDAWRARPDVAPLFDEALAAHRIDPAQRAHAEALVWAAYTTPVVLPGGERIEGFATASSMTREMDFVYPNRRGGPSVRARLARRGLRARGLTYFADWKSDSLASYAPDAIARHVAAHYEDQARLYALAVVRLLGVTSREEHEARFGGLLYCFLRGFGAEQGVWSARPSWDEIVAWDEGLRARTERGSR